MLLRQSFSHGVTLSVTDLRSAWKLQELAYLELPQLLDRIQISDATNEFGAQSSSSWDFLYHERHKLALAKQDISGTAVMI